MKSRPNMPELGPRIRERIVNLGPGVRDHVLQLAEETATMLRETLDDPMLDADQKFLMVVLMTLSLDEEIGRLREEMTRCALS